MPCWQRTICRSRRCGREAVAGVDPTMCHAEIRRSWCKVMTLRHRHGRHGSSCSTTELERRRTSRRRRVLDRIRSVARHRSDLFVGLWTLPALAASIRRAYGFSATGADGQAWRGRRPRLAQPGGARAAAFRRRQRREVLVDGNAAGAAVDPLRGPGELPACTWQWRA